MGQEGLFGRWTAGNHCTQICRGCHCGFPEPKEAEDGRGETTASRTYLRRPSLHRLQPHRPPTGPCPRLLGSSAIRGIESHDARKSSRHTEAEPYSYYHRFHSKQAGTSVHWGELESRSPSP